MNSEDALADLMSIADVGARRDLIARDVGSEQSYACISRLVMALALDIPFGKDRHWRRLRRLEMPGNFTNEHVISLLKEKVRGVTVIQYFHARMHKRRFEELSSKFNAFHFREVPEITFQFTYDEMEQVEKLMAVELGEDLGGEIFWSYDKAKSPSGVELEFVFSMLSRRHLIGCVCGPYECSDEIDPFDFGLTDLDD